MESSNIWTLTATIFPPDDDEDAGLVGVAFPLVDFIL